MIFTTNEGITARKVDVALKEFRCELFGVIKPG